MIDPRLQAILDGTDAPGTSTERDPAPEPSDAPAELVADAEPATATVQSSDAEETEEAEDSGSVVVTPGEVMRTVEEMSPDERDRLVELAAANNPNMAPIAEAARADIRVGDDGRIIASDALHAAMRALVPGRDKAPTDTAHRSIGGWLSVDNQVAAQVTETSKYFTVSHWHWLAAKNMVRQMPAELGPTFPYLMTSEAQIMHDLTAWSALDEDGLLTPEAGAMFGAVTGHAELTVYGTVLLYGQRRAPAELPPELKGFGLEAAVRDVPRVTFAIGVDTREVVCAVVNNTSVVFTRRLRRGDAVTDAAAGVLDVLDPESLWKAYPLPASVVLPGTVVDQLASDPDASTLIDTEPGPDANDDARAADDAYRNKARTSTRKILQAAKTPAGAQTAIADIAGATTHALAQITVKMRDVDVSRGQPGAIALSFLLGKGIVASYPSGSGDLRRITYASGNVTGIADGLRALSSAYRGA